MQGFAVEKKEEKALGQVLGVIGSVSAPSNKGVQWIPIKPAQLVAGKI